MPHDILSGYAPPPPELSAVDSPPQPPASLAEPCNNVFQTLLCSIAFFSGVFCLLSLISSKSRDVLWIVEPHSFPVQCFSWKCVIFLARSYFNRYFSDFQRLLRVRFTSMTNTKPLGGVVCHHCHNPGHVRQNFSKLSNKIRRFQYVYHQKSLWSAFASISTLVKLGKTNTCFISSFSTWVIDSEVTDHMTCNSGLFTTFQSRPSTSIVILADVLTSCGLGLGTIHLTPLISLTSVPSLPQFSFNLISVSKPTCTLNCSISSFPDYCLIQDLLTEWIIGR